jgi:hypothetical protein
MNRSRTVSLNTRPDYYRLIVTRIPARRLIFLPLLGAIALLVADATRAIRPSMMSATGCIGVLFAESPEAIDLVRRYQDKIAAEAAKNDLPPELLAAVIINHQAYQPVARRLSDCLGSALGANLSLGLAQIRISTAAQLDGRHVRDLSPSEFRELRLALLSPEKNIAYQGREMRFLLDRKNRFPGLGADALIHDPFKMALLITEYRMGAANTASQTSRLSAAAFTALGILEEETLTMFARDPSDVIRIRGSILEYLESVYCHSGIFNEGVCDDWQSSHTA